MVGTIDTTTTINPVIVTPKTYTRDEVEALLWSAWYDASPMMAKNGDIKDGFNKWISNHFKEE